MISIPNCKINLGLHILRKRPDDYHDIETIFYPVQWADVLEIVPSEELKFSASGLAIDGKPEDNLCLKAYQILNKKYNLPPVHIHLHKIVPMGAGLGGGSSDAAFTLKVLNEKFKLNIPKQELANIASELGSDCTFFTYNNPCLATGRGTDISEIDFSLKGKFIVIIYPKIHVSTKLAYSKVKPSENAESLTAIIKRPLAEWKNILKNDFEQSVFSEFTEIAEIKENFYQQGAVYSSLSGSGSAVFGIFENETTIKTNPDYTIWSGYLS